MVNKIRYDFKDDCITISEDCNSIHLYEDNSDCELSFRMEDIEKVITLLENLKNYMDDKGHDYVDLGTFEGEDDDGTYTEEYYWNDDYVMDDRYINPYFSPGDFFYGNCIYKDGIQYILDALREYLNPSSIDRLDELTLKSMLRLKRNLTK